LQECKVHPNPKCPMFGNKPTITQLIEYGQLCGIRGQEAAAPPTAASDWGITVDELKGRLDRNEKLFILDVRNPEEFQICRIPGSTLLPLPELPSRFKELNPDQEM